MVRLFHINIPPAVAMVTGMACKQERIGNTTSAQHWFLLAQELEGGKFLSYASVEELCESYPFLSRFKQ